MYMENYSLIGALCDVKRDIHAAGVVLVEHVIGCVVILFIYCFYH